MDEKLNSLIFLKIFFDATLQKEIKDIPVEMHNVYAPQQKNLKRAERSEDREYVSE